MNLLEFGMMNRKSSSALVRGLARAALKVERERADRLEKKILREDIRIVEEPDDGRMLEEIRKRIQKDK